MLILILLYLSSVIITVWLLRVAFKRDRKWGILGKPDIILALMTLFPFGNLLLAGIAMSLTRPDANERVGERWFDRLFGYKRRN